METRLSYSGRSGAWTAVLRDGRKVLAECGHNHRNRDSGIDNAWSCGTGLALAARNRHTTAILIVDQAVASAGRARQLGARITNDEARAKAEATIAAWREVVTARDFHTKADWSQRVYGGRTCGCCPATTT